MVEFSPTEFYAFEVLGGWLGAAGGGVGGFFLGFFLCLLGMGEDGTGYGALGCLVGGGALGYLVGTPLGATAGVAVVGALYGVEGNLGFSLMGAIAGEGAGVLTVSTLAGVGLGDPLGGAAYVLGVPLVSAVGAALGYNVDAKLTGAAPAP